MLNAAETTSSAAIAAAATNAAQETADGDLFAQELQNRLATVDTDKITESLNKLASAFPNTTFTQEQVGSFQSSTTFFLQIDSGTTVNLSPAVMEQMGSDEELFEKVKTMIGSLFSASESQTILPANGTVSSTGVFIDELNTRFVEVQRDDNGRALSLASLTMETQRLVSESIEKLFANINGTANRANSGSNGVQGLWQLLGSSTQASTSNGFNGLVSSSSSWQLEGIFFQASTAQQSLQSSQQMVGSMDMIIAQWEESGTSTDLFTYMQVMGLSDPLVFDLGDEGINLTSTEDGVYFDINGDGSPVKTGWISGNNAFLYLDENGNGVADDGNELFGDQGGHANGFEKLAQYDDNGDGVIDERDAVYSELRLWRDLNGDGVNQADESLTLAEAGIKSINVNYAKEYEKDEHGNVIGERSSFTRTDGSQGLVADAWLRTEKKK